MINDDMNICSSASGGKISVKVIPRSSKNELVKLSETEWRVKLTSAPVDGKANMALIKFLASELGINQSQVRILRGEKGRNKILEVGK